MDRGTVGHSCIRTNSRDGQRMQVWIEPEMDRGTFGQSGIRKLSLDRVYNGQSWFG